MVKRALISLLLTLLFAAFSPPTTSRSHDRQDLADVQPLSQIAIHKASFALDEKAFVKASPRILGLQVLLG